MSGGDLIGTEQLTTTRLRQSKAAHCKPEVILQFSMLSEACQRQYPRDHEAQRDEIWAQAREAGPTLKRMRQMATHGLVKNSLTLSLLHS
jgi:hypothetical protein